MDIVERLAADAAYTVSELAAVGIDIQATETTVGGAAATITALRARVEELEGALGFYADKKNWWTPDAQGFGYHKTGDGMMEQLGSRCGIVEHRKGFVHPQFYPDCGRRARAALRAKGGE